MALSRQSRGVLLAAAVIDAVLGLLFIVAGSALFGVAADVALIIGLVLLGSGASMVLLAVAGRRARPGRDPGEGSDRR